MTKKIIYLWWDFFPSVNINVIYKSNKFLHSPQFYKIFVNESYKRCSELERGYLQSRYGKELNKILDSE